MKSDLIYAVATDIQEDVAIPKTRNINHVIRSSCDWVHRLLEPGTRFRITIWNSKLKREGKNFSPTESRPLRALQCCILGRRAIPSFGAWKQFGEFCSDTFPEFAHTIRRPSNARVPRNGCEDLLPMQFPNAQLDTLSDSASPR